MNITNESFSQKRRPGQTCLLVKADGYGMETSRIAQKFSWPDASLLNNTFPSP